MTLGNNLVDRRKLGIKRRILADKYDISISTVITATSARYIKEVTDPIDILAIKRTFILSNPKRQRCKKYRYLCHDRF